MTIEFLLEDLSVRRKGKFRESLSLHLLFSECLQLKIVRTPKQRISGWYALLPFRASFILYSRTLRIIMPVSLSSLCY